MIIVRRIVRILLRIVILFLIVSVGSTIVFRWVPVPFTPLMLIRCVEQKADGKEMVLKHDWVSLEKISPKLQLAVVCSEDQNYLKHFGFDWGAIQKAMKANESGKKTERREYDFTANRKKCIFMARPKLFEERL
jgi:monofunctional biosynthetic peptidoglycan transglycosylase